MHTQLVSAISNVLNAIALWILSFAIVRFLNIIDERRIPKDTPIENTNDNSE